MNYKVKVIIDSLLKLQISILRSKSVKDFFATLIFFYFLGDYSVASAQIRPLASQYYQNLYLANPAFAGVDEGLNLNINHRNQWRTIPGSPITSALTGDYRFEKVGVGVKIFSDKAGLISRNSFTASYAYHLPLTEDGHEIHFGLSLGAMKDRLDNAKVIGDENDFDLEAFNTRKMYLDGDFGLGYTTKRLNIQGVIPNMKTFFKKDQSNAVQVATMYLALSYKIGTALDVLSIEPKVGYQGASGLENIWNLGTNLTLLNDKVSFTGMYHSTRSSSLGLGLSYQKYHLQGFYTSQLAGQREATGGSFELHLRINFLKEESNQNKDIRL